MCIVFVTATDHYSLSVPLPSSRSSSSGSPSRSPGSSLHSIIASNRDEFLARPTTPAAWHHWDPTRLAQQPSPDHPVLSGLDLSAGGTWLGLSLRPASASTTTTDDTIRFATLTNFTESIPPASRPSRGNLTRDFLDLDGASSSSGSPRGASLDSYLEQVEATKAAYAGFNLLVGELKFPSSAPASRPSSSSSPTTAADTAASPTVRLGYISNRETPSKRARVLPPLGTAGHVRGLSNATLEVDEGEVEWPKVKSGAAAVERVARQVEDERRSEGLRDDEVEERLAKGLYDALRCVPLSLLLARAVQAHADSVTYTVRRTRARSSTAPTCATRSSSARSTSTPRRPCPTTRRPSLLPPLPQPPSSHPQRPPRPRPLSALPKPPRSTPRPPAPTGTQPGSSRSCSSRAARGASSCASATRSCSTRRRGRPCGVGGRGCLR